MLPFLTLLNVRPYIRKSNEDKVMTTSLVLVQAGVWKSWFIFKGVLGFRLGVLIFKDSTIESEESLTCFTHS